MGIRDNDQTANMAQGAVIVAAIRSGGTFLTHCLSNHSMIHCDRGEPLHHESVWYQNMDPSRARLLSALLNQTGYQVSMCRITYVQALAEGLWKWLVKRQPKVIWLHRENVLRQAISVYLNQTARQTDRLDRPVHTFEEPGPVQVKIDPAYFLKMARGLHAQNERVRALLPMLRDVYQLTYAQVVGGGEHKSLQPALGDI